MAPNTPPAIAPLFESSSDDFPVVGGPVVGGPIVGGPIVGGPVIVSC